MGRSESLSRRDVFKLAAAGFAGYSMSGWIERLAADTASNPQRKKSCILLWMSGGPSQMDTFDLKPGHANGGPYKEIESAVPGIHISEHLPRLAAHMEDMVLIRSMSTKEGDHTRATYYLRTGYLPQGPIQYPPLGSLVSKELGSDEAALPNFVSIAPYRIFSPAAYTPGFLGPLYAPLVVGDVGLNFAQGQGRQPNYDEALKVQDLGATVPTEQVDARIELLKDLEADFGSSHKGVSPRSHQTAYDRAVRLMKTDAAKAFNLEEENSSARDAYGRSLFGQGCLLARRLVERGVPFVEVSLGGINGNALGWDTHANNFDTVKGLSAVLDQAWATLMDDLKERGLIDSTLIVWMGEFGRTPKIARGNGRDHWPNSWSTVLAGGGIRGGQVIGKTSASGEGIDERPVSVPDFVSTVCHALGVNPKKQNDSNVGRPIRVADPTATPIMEVVS
jgi:hypothetical protein